MEEWLEVHVQRRLDEYATSQSNKLNLEGLKLGPFLPENVFEAIRAGLFRQPDEFNLEHNKLEALPNNLADDLPHLLTLRCSDNHLYALPKLIGSLSSLTRVELDRNALTYLPESIGQLKHLAHLSLDSNQLAELPATIGTPPPQEGTQGSGGSGGGRKHGDLESLEVLQVANNRLSFLPLEMSKLPRLKQLGINNNKFGLFPPVIPQILTLTSISIAFNEGIKEIIPLHTLTQLTELQVEEGKKLGIPTGIVPSGPSAIFTYLSFFDKFSSVRFDLERHWIPDEQASRCAICQSNFTAFFRKHHCRMCGRVTCKKCTDKKHAVPANNEEWGLTQADQQSLPADQQRNKLATHKAEIEALIASKTQSRVGLAKLVTFYAKDPVAQKKAMAELEQMDELLSSLNTHRTTVMQQLQTLALPDETQHQQGSIDEPQQQLKQEMGEEEKVTTTVTSTRGEPREPPMKAKVLYTFQAQSEGEMNVFSGTIVTLLEPQPNGDWWLIEFNGRSGYVPQTYLTPL